MLDTYMPSLHHALLPSAIGPMVSTFLTSVHDTLVGAIASMDGASGPLQTFIIPPAYRAGAHAAFGPDFPVERSWQAFQTFDEGLPMLSAGLPKFMLRKPLKAWDDLISVIEEYIMENEDRLEELGPFIQAAVDGRRDNWVCSLSFSYLRHPNLLLVVRRAVTSPTSLLFNCGLSKPTSCGPHIGLSLSSFNNPRASHPS